jgi:hypothetical protein
MIVDAIVNDLTSDQTGYNWWRNLSPERREEFKNTWEQLVQGVRHPGDIKKGSK